MEINLNSKYYRYYTKLMKPHPVLEGVKWYVLDGEKMTVVIFEEKPALARAHNNLSTYKTDGVPHNHDGIEQVNLFLGFSDDTPDEVKTSGYKSLRCMDDKIGIFGSNVIQWIPAGIEHNIPVPPDVLSCFEKNSLFPNGYPDGTTIYTAIIFSPPRQDFCKLWNSLSDN